MSTPTTDPPSPSGATRCTSVAGPTRQVHDPARARPRSAPARARRRAAGRRRGRPSRPPARRAPRRPRRCGAHRDQRARAGHERPRGVGRSGGLGGVAEHERSGYPVRALLCAKGWQSASPIGRSTTSSRSRTPRRSGCATMLLIRRFEERAGEMYAKAKVGGFLHLAIGEEATIVGSCRALRDADYLISTYRSHGHALVRGTSPDSRHGRAVRPGRRHVEGPRRVDAHVRPREALHGRLRDRRRQPADRRGHGARRRTTSARRTRRSACSATARRTRARSARR